MTAPWEIRASASSLPSAVRVRNLQTSITGPADAWGRPNKPQPILVSASIWPPSHDILSGPSFSTDRVAHDTVHYGHLSKAILSVLSSSHGHDLGSVVGNVWETAREFVDGGVVEVQVRLPKGTLAGDGVSVTRIARAGGSEEATSLGVDVRLPVLIGVNENERGGRQTVVARLEVENISLRQVDAHHRLTGVLTEIMEESSFETLEALGRQIVLGITKTLHESFSVHQDSPGTRESWGLRLSLEKPIAVVFAEAACVEIYVNTADVVEG